MEKIKPAYDLEKIKQKFSRAKNLKMTLTAQKCVNRLGLHLEDVILLIQSLKINDFYKSMTTYHDHRIWQDVYRKKYKSINLYIKFMKDYEDYFF